MELSSARYLSLAAVLLVLCRVLGAHELGTEMAVQIIVTYAWRSASVEFQQPPFTNLTSPVPSQHAALPADPPTPKTSLTQALDPET